MIIIFYMKSSFLGWSIFVSIDHVILEFPMILVVSYTCAITFLLTYNGLLQIHPTHWFDIRYEFCQGVLMWPKTIWRCSKCISKCPESVSRCPHLFQTHIVTATSSIMVSQVTPGGVSRCIHMCRKNRFFQKLNICLGGLISILG